MHEISYRSLDIRVVHLGMHIMFTIPGNLKFECSHMLHGLSSPFTAMCTTGIPVLHQHNQSSCEILDSEVPFASLLLSLYVMQYLSYPVFTQLDFTLEFQNCLTALQVVHSNA